MTMRTVRFGSLLLAAFLLAGLTGWSVNRFWPRHLIFAPEPALPVCEVSAEGTTVRVPGRFFVAEIGRFEDELFAYLMFEFFRGARALKGTEVILTYVREGNSISYPLLLVMPDDLLVGIPMLAKLEAENWFPEFTWRVADKRVLDQMRRQSETVVMAYSLPAYRKLEHLTPRELVQYTRRFVRFKSTVDPRARRQLALFPGPLDRAQAKRLAEDVVTVADFFSLPLDLFLGIGAMENNYMNIKGDIGNAIWKRKAEKGDVVLRRQGGRVLVLNESVGVWQITRETLRYAHRLYLADKRDYSRLPEHLRPPKTLDLSEIDPAVLTTYAGLIFRNLVDRLGGDVPKAVGAYNGGPGRPNMQYEAGVRAAAEYARHVMEQAAALNGEPVAEVRFLSSLRGRDQ